MKIALCAPVDIHWLARFCSEPIEQVAPGLGSTATTPLILELLLRGHEVTVYTLSHGLADKQVYKWKNLRVVVGPSRAYGAARNFYLPEIAFLKQEIQAERPDFVHAHWTYEFALGALASGRKALITIHDLPWNVLRFFRDRSRAVRLLMAYTVAAKANTFTAVSEDASRHFRRYMRPGARITVIPNFLPRALLSKSKGPRPHPKRPLVFATVLQGWTRQKNPKAALAAFALFRKTMPEARLMMLGIDYHEGGPASDWAAKNRLSEGVRFCGCLPYHLMLDFLINSVDALIMPSLNEALSMTVSENMALGTPIIAGGSTPGIREQLDSGKAGLIVDVHKPDSIAKAMMMLQEDHKLFEMLSRAAYQRAVTLYCAEAVIPQYEKLYSQFS